MFSFIKNVCIFMIIVQAILLLVPGNNYMKYVKLLVEILMILMISKPVLMWIQGEEGTEIGKILKELEEGMPVQEEVWEAGESNMGIYSSIEEELKYRLNQAFETDVYYVKGVELRGLIGENDTGQETIPEYLRITVVRQKEEKGKITIESVVVGEESVMEEKEAGLLKEKYGECIGVDPERIEIRVSYG